MFFYRWNVGANPHLKVCRCVLQRAQMMVSFFSNGVFFEPRYVHSLLGYNAVAHLLDCGIA